MSRPVKRSILVDGMTRTYLRVARQVKRLAVLSYWCFMGPTSQQTPFVDIRTEL
jgi:hypothetical protein